MYADLNARRNPRSPRRVGKGRTRNGYRSEELAEPRPIGGFVQFMREGLECGERVSVQVHRPSGAVLRSCEVNGAAVEMHLFRCEGVLL
jgi:hypothetical protein